MSRLFGNFFVFFEIFVAYWKLACYTQCQNEGDKMNIGSIIESRRKELGLTLEQVGNAVGVGKSTVKKWESGYIENMKRDKIALLANILNLSPVVLITGEYQYENTKTPPPLTAEENKILEAFSKLNPTGKAEAINRVEELTEISKYTFSAPSSADKAI